MSFEHLARTQPEVASRLSEELERNLIPSSVLISGSPYSSRMTAAIELALTLLGESDKFSSLDTNSLIILTERDMELRLTAAVNLYRKQKNTRSLSFLVQSIRTFLLSFHAALSSSADDALLALASEVGDQLYLASSDFDAKEAEAWLKNLEKPLNALLAKNRKKGGFTIDNIRDISAFFQSSGDERRAVILENIENVTQGAMNSILKLLEEPPQNAHIILVSASAGRILDTILSRVRKYELPPVSEELSRAFLRDNFFSSAQTLEEFFYTESGFDYERAVREADSFIENLVVEKRPISTADLTSLASFLDEFSSYPLFFTLAMKKLTSLLDSGKAECGAAARAGRILSSSYNEALTYNQNRRVLLDRVSRELINE